MWLRNQKNRSGEWLFFRASWFWERIPGLGGWIGAGFLWIVLIYAPVVMAQDRGTTPAPSSQQVLLGPPVKDFRLGERRTENPFIVLPSVGRGVKLWDEVRYRSGSSPGSGPHDGRVSVRRVGR
jgi:hypothetical protein